ncbi:unnamed protein product [Discosporangium mesarthrocarpum]
MTGYLRQFTPQYCQIAAPMTDLLRGKEMPGKNAQKTSFGTLKQRLMTPPVLLLPDWSMTFRLSTDGVIVGAGTALAQVKEDGLDHVIAYASHRWSITDSKRAATELDWIVMLCVINN